VTQAQTSVPLLDTATAWIDELPDGLLVCAPDGRISLLNQRLADMTGYAREALQGEPLDRLVPPDVRGRHADLRARFVHEGRTRPMGPGLDLRLVRRDGSLLPVEISLAPISVGEAGASPGVVAIVRDVSERLRAAQTLRTAQDLLTLAQERERIARDLHDTVLQRLFGLGMELQATAMRAEPAVGERLERAVDEIDRIIREIRTAVFTLGSAGRDGSLGQELGTLVAQSTRVLGWTPRLRMDGPVESSITPEIRVELMASLREALGNVARHANGTEAEIEITADDRIVMRVVDNGRGIAADVDVTAGNGLRNMAERARLLGGDCVVGPRPVRGTELTWWVPIPR